MLLFAALTLAWVLNPSFGPSPQILQIAIAAAAGILWFALAPQLRGSAPVILAAAWLAGAVVNAGIGVAQHFGLVEDSSLWLSAASAGEAFGNLRQRNQQATLMAIGLASAFFLLTRLEGRVRILLAACVVLLSAANALTSSRTGMLHWLVLSAGAMLLPLWGAPTWWRRWSVLAAGSYAAVVGLVLWAAPALFERLTASASCVSRKVLWSNAWHLALERPWTGWGPGGMDYAHYATLYPGERFCLIVDNAHNLFLHAAVEAGLPVAVLLLVALVAVVLRARPWRDREPQRLLAWAVLGAILLHSMVEYPLWYGPFQLAAVLAVSLLWRGGTRSGAGEPAAGEVTAPTAPMDAPSSARSAVADAPDRPSGLRLLLCTGAAAIVAYVAWDYHRISQLYLPEAERSALYRHDAFAAARRSVLFAGQVEFAEFTTTTLTGANAQRFATLGERVLRYSPEPQVIEKLIEALRLLGRGEEARWHEARFELAFPEEHAAWAGKSPAGSPAAQ